MNFCFQVQVPSCILQQGIKKETNSWDKVSLDVLVSFLAGFSCKNQFCAAFSASDLPYSAKYPWKEGFKTPHCQPVIFLYQFLPNKFQIPC